MVNIDSPAAHVLLRSQDEFIYSSSETTLFQSYYVGSHLVVCRTSLPLCSWSNVKCSAALQAVKQAAALQAVKQAAALQAVKQAAALQAVKQAAALQAVKPCLIVFPPDKD